MKKIKKFYQRGLTDRLSVTYNVPIAITKEEAVVGDENVCIACGDLKDDIGRCYTCSEDHVELRKDFIWEYCHEIDTLVDSQFRRILPDCDYS